MPLQARESSVHHRGVFARVDLQPGSTLGVYPGRPRNAAAMAAKAKLAELRALRASGKSRLSSYNVQEEEDLYDEVDEESYKKVVRGRLDQDDFVIDDNGGGYADDGREEWIQERHYDSQSGSEEEQPLRGKAGEAQYVLLILQGSLTGES